MIHSFVAVCLFGGALARVTHVDNAEMRPLQAFDMDAFLGKWYEVERSSESDVDCTTIEWKPSESNDVHVILEGRVIATNESFRIPSYPVQRTLDISNHPQFELTFPISPLFSIYDPKVNINFIKIHYQMFAIVFGFGASISDSYVQILTRKRHPSEGLMREIHTYVKNSEEIATIKLHKTNQLDCVPDEIAVILFE